MQIQGNRNAEHSNANLVTKENKSEIEYCFTISASTVIESKRKVQFILDLGATDQLSQDKEYLTNIERLETPITIKVSKAKSTLEVHFTGTLNLRCGLRK